MKFHKTCLIVSPRTCIYKCIPKILAVFVIYLNYLFVLGRTLVNCHHTVNTSGLIKADIVFHCLHLYFLHIAETDQTHFLFPSYWWIDQINSFFFILVKLIKPIVFFFILVKLIKRIVFFFILVKLIKPIVFFFKLVKLIKPIGVFFILVKLIKPFFLYFYFSFWWNWYSQCFCFKLVKLI